MDIDGAFDNVSFDSALRQMREAGVNDNIVGWFGDYLNGRNISCNLRGDTVTVSPRKGTPQGGVLSPIIWNLIMDGWVQKIYNEQLPIEIICYADDILIISRGDKWNLDIQRQVLQKAIDILSNSARDDGLTFSETKSFGIIFRPYYDRTDYDKWGLENQLKVYGKPFQYVDQVRYLGVIFDSKLSWDPHVKQVIKNAKRNLIIYSAAVKATWGLRPNIRQWVFKGVVLPELLMELWFGNQKLT